MFHYNKVYNTFSIFNLALEFARSTSFHYCLIIQSQFRCTLFHFMLLYFLKMFYGQNIAVCSCVDLESNIFLTNFHCQKYFVFWPSFWVVWSVKTLKIIKFHVPVSVFCIHFSLLIILIPCFYYFYITFFKTNCSKVILISTIGAFLPKCRTSVFMIFSTKITSFYKFCWLLSFFWYFLYPFLFLSPFLLLVFSAFEVL